MPCLHPRPLSATTATLATTTLLIRVASRHLAPEPCATHHKIKIIYFVINVTAEFIIILKFS